MNILEEFILLLGFSWQMSNLLPFILLFLSSVFVVIFLRKKSKKTTFNFLIRFLVSIIPLSLYFGFNPVFESDIYTLFSLVQLFKYQAFKQGLELKTETTVTKAEIAELTKMVEKGEDVTEALKDINAKNAYFGDSFKIN